MQRVMGNLRRAVNDYRMIKAGDSVAVALSGGKDSVALLLALAKSRSFLVEGGFSLCAITVDNGFEGADFSALHSLCDELDVPLHILKTDIYEIVFKAREEKSPCSLCSRLRRGALLGEAERLGCNVLALGHHMDDALETFMMSLFTEGRISCFLPVTDYEDRGIRLIRPLVYCTEREIGSAVAKSGAAIEKSRCPIDKQTSRQREKERLLRLEREQKGVKKRLFTALQNGVDGWGKISND